MAVLELVGELLGKVDFEKSKIVQPRKLVFVCGGTKSGKPEAPRSMREILLTKAEAAGKPGELSGVKVVLAEAAVNSLAESSFENLLDLERYIAAIVHAVVLIVESPGSMCELGAFVVTPEICKKLIVVLQSEHVTPASFITSGAIKYFKGQEKTQDVDARILISVGLGSCNSSHLGSGLCRGRDDANPFRCDGCCACIARKRVIQGRGNWPCHHLDACLLSSSACGKTDRHQKML